MNKNIITELQKVAMQQNWGGVERTNGLPKNVEIIYEAIKTIEQLQKEKENCITPPVKLGTKIYKIVYNANIDKKEIYPYILDYCDNEKYYTDHDYLIHEFRTHYFKDFNKTWFLTKEEAENKLKELKK